MIRTLAALAAFVLLAVPAHAEERILSYDSTIEAHASGTLRVTEVIEVTAEGNKIKRGIYRDFPLYATGDDGKRHKVGFEIVSVERDGEAEPYTTNYGGSGVRIYIGDADVFLARGTYTYTLTYDTTRQIRFFDDHDEIYWNVTGNEWDFAIDRASALVTLPEGARATRWTAYTGAFGARGTDWEAREESGGRSIAFATTRPLGRSEGLTIVVAVPKGVFDESAAQSEAFWLDNGNAIKALAAILVVAAYYLRAWRRVGRDPEKGTIIPLFSAPDGVSPALANYIHFKGLSGGGWEALSAACIDLAVKGHLVLEDLDGDLTLTPVAQAGPLTGLPKGEQTIMEHLGGEPLTLSKANGTSVSALGSAFRDAITTENRNKFFRSNTRHALGGIALSIVALIVLLVAGDFAEDDIVFIFPVFVLVGIMSFLAYKILNIRSRARGPMGVVQVVLAFMFGVVFASGFALSMVDLLAELEINLVLSFTIVMLVALDALFFVLLSAPTKVGRGLMDQIEGLKLYLSVAETDRMNMAGAPAMSPSRFETLLPYAVALKAEKPWSEAFASWLAAASAAGAVAYAPVWYHGRSFEPSTFGRTMTDTVHDMSRSFTSSLPTPKSSSSGFSSGGGSSGGGGGGGGGGGW
ncbi:DUF2207 domain-containing protein [Breoghania sp. L-A4]|uniref:DUF2207 domain-containing protein n=1 Tax=Breoghania sp. L-A4 TaxID=2304600 RepID=UPI0013C2B86E|nr:DUF2207 domain-containing protein [Breoghania sp. L-A4]